jgi:phosphoribosylformylglycinamidine cyclo-ligase
MTTYAAAGVSLAAAEGIVARLAAAAQSTWSEAVVGRFGGFAGLYALDHERLLAASTDGAGTKLVIARKAGRLRDAGRDLAAHCVNDVLTTGAEPIFFLDYVAAGRLDPEQVAELVDGAADVCRAAGCALLGGEAAEMPGVYRDGEIDFAGTCVGLVHRKDLVDGSRVEAGDRIVGLASAGVHANGFTLVRSVLAEEGYDGDDMLAPTRLYLDDVRRLRERADVRGLAHVTGGGILGNVSRILPDGVRAEIDWDAWKRPAVFDWLARHVDEHELRRVFNLGIGYCAVLNHREAQEAGFPVIGKIVHASP